MAEEGSVCDGGCQYGSFRQWRYLVAKIGTGDNRSSNPTFFKSLLALVKEFPQLRIYSIRAALNFGSLLAMWSCLAFKMGQAPFFANSDVIGMLGLCGVAGALTASFVGRYVKRVGVRRFNFIGCGLILLSWLLFFVGENTYAGIIAGIIMIDIGMQCIQLSNRYIRADPLEYLRDDAGYNTKRPHIGISSLLFFQHYQPFNEYCRRSDRI